MDPTLTYSSDIAFTPSVKAVQSRKGSRRAYGGLPAAWQRGWYHQEPQGYFFRVRV